MKEKKTRNNDQRRLFQDRRKQNKQRKWFQDPKDKPT